jgi:UDP-N-acetylglucosamine acyltransferase
MSREIHATAIVDPKAELGNNVKIGPYSIIGPNVQIGDHTEIGPHVVIHDYSKIGEHNKIYQFASIGEEPQDLKFKKGDVTYLEVGDHNVFREFCTLNRGTIQSTAVTKIGSHNLVMAYAHVAHDCVVGNHVIMANSASLAGHVQVDDFASLGGLSAVHQFSRIGAHSFAAGGSMINKDVLPCSMVSGYYAKPFGLNSVGLKRRGFSDERIAKIKRMYKVVYRQGLTLKEAIAELDNNYSGCEDYSMFIELLKNSQRGIVR